MTTSTINAYDAAIATRDEALAEIAALEAAHATRVAQLRGIIAQNQGTIDVAERGFDPAVYEQAAELVEIRWARTLGQGQRPGWDTELTGPHKVTAEVLSALSDAIEDVRHGGGYLGVGYRGVKHYDRWASQREDHEYGRGPRHGSIWFSVGLAPAARKRDLTTEERIAVAAWLTALTQKPELLP